MASDSCSCSLATNHKTCPLPGKTEDLYTMPSVPGYPKLRAGTQLDAIWGRMLATGKGYRRPGIKKEPGTCPGLPRVMVVFDTQCPWSHRLWDTAMILKDEIDFLWFPVCVTKDVSTAQAAAILASDTPGLSPKRAKSSSTIRISAASIRRTIRSPRNSVTSPGTTPVSSARRAALRCRSASTERLIISSFRSSATRRQKKSERLSVSAETLYRDT